MTQIMLNTLDASEAMMQLTLIIPDNVLISVQDRQSLCTASDLFFCVK